ncbi:MAG: phosphatase PAP2 family protein [Chloroflexi bacterium]|nr:phosphatase PAP2 family protein [Chloroflexota bacterium]
MEKAAGFFWEPAWQDWALDIGEPVALFFNWSYILTFMPIAIPTAIIVYVTNRERYRFYRNVVIITMAVAVLVFALFPLAPPRLLPETFVDTLDVFGPAFYTSRDDASYFNEFAAMPSVHYSWTLVFGVLFFTSGPRWLKIAGVAYPTLTLLAITVTGNHYIMDAVGGALLMLVAFGVAHALRRFQANRIHGASPVAV